MAASAEVEPISYLTFEQERMLDLIAAGIDPALVHNEPTTGGESHHRWATSLALAGVAGSTLFQGAPAVAEAASYHPPASGDRMIAASHDMRPRAYTGAGAAERMAFDKAHAQLEHTLRGRDQHVEELRVTAGMTFDGLEDHWRLPRGTISDMNPNEVPTDIQIDQQNGSPEHIKVPDATARASLAAFNEQYQHQDINVSGSQAGLGNLPARGAGILVRNADGSDTALQLKYVYRDDHTKAMMVHTMDDRMVPLSSVVAFTQAPVPETLAKHVQAVHRETAGGGESPTTAVPFNNSPQPGEETIHHKEETQHSRQQHQVAHRHHNPRTQPARFHAPDRHDRYHRTHRSPQLQTGQPDIPGEPGYVAFPGAVTGEQHPQHPDHPQKPQHESINRALGNIGTNAAIPGVPSFAGQTSEGLQSGGNTTGADHVTKAEARAAYEHDVRDNIVSVIEWIAPRWEGKTERPSVQRFTAHTPENDCADTYSYIRNQARFPITFGQYPGWPSNDAPRVETLYDGALAHDQYLANNGPADWTKLQPGDAILLGSPGGFYHMETIWKVDGRFVTTFGGDTLPADAAGNLVYRTHHHVDLGDPRNDIGGFLLLFPQHGHVDVPARYFNTPHSQKTHGSSSAPVGLLDPSIALSKPQAGDAWIPGVTDMTGVTSGHPHHQSGSHEHHGGQGFETVTGINGHFAGGEWHSDYLHPHTVEAFVVNTLSMLAAANHVPESHFLNERNIKILTAWALSEGGNLSPKSHYHNNVFNTGYKDVNLIDGVPNDSGLQSYKTMVDGALATVETISAPNQSRILHALSNPHLSEKQVLWAIAYYPDYTGNGCWACTDPAIYYNSMLDSLSQVESNYPGIAGIVIGEGQVGQHHNVGSIRYAGVVAGRRPVHRAPARPGPSHPAQPTPSTRQQSGRHNPSSSPTIGPNPVPGPLTGPSSHHGHKKDSAEIPGVTPGGLYPNPQP